MGRIWDLVRYALGLGAVMALIYWGGPVLDGWIKFPAWLPGALDTLRLPGALLMAAGAVWMVAGLHVPTMIGTNPGPDGNASHFNLRAARRTVLVGTPVNDPGDERQLQSYLEHHGVALPISAGDIVVWLIKYEGTKVTPLIAHNASKNIYATNAAEMAAMTRLGSPSTSDSAFFFGAVMVALSGTLWMAPLAIVLPVALFEWCHAALSRRYLKILIDGLLLPALQEGAANETKLRQARG